ncbi:MAG TPA: 50S ribosomal protein L21 [Gaiellaceae bacterium]|nr:50S ribosomal protein L21 [Gaiellaceae bacterium]
MSYAIISVGGKQHRVQEGEKLLVERLGVAEGKTFEPRVLMLGGDGDPDLSPKDGSVTVRVVGHVLGNKIVVGKYRRRTGYRRHTGHRSKLTQIQVESIGAKKRAAAKKGEAAAEDKPKAAAKKPAKPKAKPAAAKKTEENDGA